jgi:hypothetical protein
MKDTHEMIMDHLHANPDLCQDPRFFALCSGIFRRVGQDSGMQSALEDMAGRPIRAESGETQRIILYFKLFADVAFQNRVPIPELQIQERVRWRQLNRSPITHVLAVVLVVIRALVARRTFRIPEKTMAIVTEADFKHLKTERALIRLL